jgi:hypothetical protein
MSRILLFILALAATLEAQTPPRVPLPDWRTLLRSVVVTPPRGCAVPLVNVLRPAPTEPMPIVRPPAEPRFPMAQVQVPAPSCDTRPLAERPER